MKILTIILMILVLCSLIIINNNDLDISNKQDIKKLSESYFKWTNQSTANIKTLTGNIVKLNWFPE